MKTMNRTTQTSTAIAAVQATMPTNTTTPTTRSVLSLSALIALQALFLAACSEAPNPPAAAPAPIVQGNQIRFAPNHPQLALLGLSAAAASPTLTIELPAKLIWNEDRTQRLYASISGRVTAIRADIGQHVSAGQTLAILASPEFGAAQADTAKAQIDLRTTQKTLTRQQELFAAGIIARKELDTAEADAARAAAESSRAEARTKLYGGTNNSGGVSQQQLTLSSTINGMVVERNLNPGQELRADQSGVGVPPLFVVSDPSQLWVQIDAKETDLAALKVGQSFELVVPSLNNKTFTANIKTVGDYIDPVTRTIKVRGVISNAERLLKTEMLGTAKLARKVEGGVAVPATAALLNGAKHYVFVQSTAGVFEPREVELGFEGPQFALIVKGLAAGENVVSENTLLLARLYRMSRDNTPAVPDKAKQP
jgi:membrane fusion protein, heavy metal efflux system